jgi:hypothetical protein
MSNIVETERTAADIVEGIEGAAAGAVVSWITGKLLNAIFGGQDEDVQLAQQELQTILKNQLVLQQTLENIISEITAAEYQTEIFTAVTSIQNLFNTFNGLAYSSESKDEKNNAIDKLVKAVLDDSSGIQYSLYQIDSIARGLNPLGGDGESDPDFPGFIGLVMKTNLTQVRQNSASKFFIDAYYNSLSFLNSLFYLQYQGAILVMNCLYYQQIKAGNNPPNMDAINQFLSGVKDSTGKIIQMGFKDTLQAQIDLQNQVTPDALKLIAGLPTASSTFTVLLKNVQSNQYIFQYLQSDQQIAPSICMSLRAPEGGVSEEWVFIPDDSLLRSFHIRPKNDQYADDVYQFDVGYWQATWWAGKDHPQTWQIVPSSNYNCVLIQNGAQAPWQYASHKTPLSEQIGAKSVDWPYVKVTNMSDFTKEGKDGDESSTQWVMIPTDPLPNVFP